MTGHSRYDMKLRRDIFLLMQDGKYFGTGRQCQIPATGKRLVNVRQQGQRCTKTNPSDRP